MDTLYPYYKEICEYIPFIAFAERMVVKLRVEEKCDLVIALTHMMKFNDMKLAKQVKGIDLILGGHDHHIVHEKVAGSVLVKSGCDFKNFSVLRIKRNRTGIIEETRQEGETTFIGSEKWRIEVELKEVNHEKEKIEPDAELDNYVELIYKQFKVKMEKVACFTKNEIDLRFKTIRIQQSPYP